MLVRKKKKKKKKDGRKGGREGGKGDERSRLKERKI